VDFGSFYSESRRKPYGISAWEASALPLSYTRDAPGDCHGEPAAVNMLLSGLCA
jgi:hypothetical protein